MKPIALAVFCAALPTLAAADLSVTDPWARASILASRPGAAYLTLESDIADQLTALETPAAGHVMLHDTVTDTNGVSRMNHIEALDLTPGTPVTFAPGGMHLMLMDLTGKLEEGSTFPLTLTFENAGEITVEVPVLSVTATGPGNAE
ncbi:copper chaperone PCu(A)C [Roseovarius nitratireducens]|uniref:copper chaperone PCu(A)C n=1 Tax=Roseovarius nitratireducens TaxID=2044597 RepID=UPI000CE1D754|nr:copper chaperone PCu(A)C [Roseovarius nitratireducens]